MTRKICFDLDGVICDQAVALIARLGLPEGFEWPPGVWDVTEATGLTRDEFFNRISDHGFWAYEMPPTPFARELFSAAVALVGLENIRIISCPTTSPFSASGKFEWVRRHFPELQLRQIVLACDKAICARPGSVLLDDKPSNVDEWRAAGGEAILVPAIWNSRHHLDPKSVIPELQSLFSSSVEAGDHTTATIQTSDGCLHSGRVAGYCTFWSSKPGV